MSYFSSRIGLLNQLLPFNMSQYLKNPYNMIFTGSYPTDISKVRPLFRNPCPQYLETRFKGSIFLNVKDFSGSEMKKSALENFNPCDSGLTVLFAMKSRTEIPYVMSRYLYLRFLCCWNGSFTRTFPYSIALTSFVIIWGIRGILKKKPTSFVGNWLQKKGNV